jgi:hypothetical protein
MSRPTRRILVGVEGSTNAADALEGFEHPDLGASITDRSDGPAGCVEMELQIFRGVEACG